MASKLILLSCLLAVGCASKLQQGFRWSGKVGGGVASRIVGGIDAEVAEFPHQVSLQWGIPPFLPLTHICGGSILNERWILTAAHCPKGVPFGDLNVKAGKHKINSREQTEQAVKVEKTFVHHKFPGNVGPYDIALLKLRTPLKINEFVQPIDLPKADSIPSGDVVLSGWGSTSTGKVPKMPNTLQKAKLPVVDLATCKSAIEELSGPSPLAETNLCTGPLTGGQSACSGDSGGPLIQSNESGKPEVVGIVSWGLMPCGSKGAPSVYTRVSAYNDWIESTIANNS